MIDVSILHHEDYDEILGQAPDRAVPDPAYTVAAAAVDGNGELVGRCFLVVLSHIEAPWIREDHRGGTLLKRLESLLVEYGEEFGIGKVFAFAGSPKLANYLERLGYTKSDLTVYEKGK